MYIWNNIILHLDLVFGDIINWKMYNCVPTSKVKGLTFCQPLVAGTKCIALWDFNILETGYSD